MKVQEMIDRPWMRWVVGGCVGLSTLTVAGPAVAVGCPLNPIPASASFAVTTEADLVGLATDVSFADCLVADLVQTADITLTVSPWTPIDGFEGSYDGDDHSILGLVLGGDDAGLFAVGVGGASFSDLNITVTSTAGGSRLGALVGVSSGGLDISGLDVTGSVVGTGDYVGGIVGRVTGIAPVSISNSSMTGIVSGRGYIGGVVAEVVNAPLSIVSTPVDATISGTEDFVGGVIGFPNGASASISDSSVTGDVSGRGYVGGVLGFSANAAVTISSSAVNGNVTGSEDYVGGVAGFPNGASASISGSPVTGDVSGRGYVGGVLGFSANAAVTISSSAVNGDVTGSEDYVGGYIGSYGSSSALSFADPTVSGNVSGRGSVGGLVGFAPNAALAVVGGSIVGDVMGTDEYAGGIVGTMGGAGDFSVTRTSIIGDVRADQYVGGVAGFVPDAKVTLRSIESEGDVTAAFSLVPPPAYGDYVGGLVGMVGGGVNKPLSIIDVGRDGNVRGSSYVGGLVGFVPNSEVIVDSTTVTGNVTGFFDPLVVNSGRNVGGLIGMHTAAEELNVSDSAIVGSTSGSTYVGGLIGFVPNAEVLITRAVVEGNVTGLSDPGVFNSGSNIGGFLGSVSTSQAVRITSGYVNGAVLGSDVVGGLIGFVPASEFSIEKSFVRGSVTGSGSYVGGLVGQGFSDAVIDSSFVRAPITGDDAIGGLIGWIPANIDLSDSYFEGTVSANGPDKGSLVGRSLGGTLTIDASFCIDPDCPNDRLITIVELKSPTFLEAQGWDLQNVWCVRSDLNDGFPSLRSITFGSLDTSRCRPMSLPISKASLDPAGGECRDVTGRLTTKTVLVFVGYRFLPSANDCLRAGHDFEGWADPAEPSVVMKMPLLVDPVDGKKRFFITADADLVAVWKKTSDETDELEDLRGTAPGAFVGGPDRATREGGGVVDGYYIPPGTRFGPWMLAR